MCDALGAAADVHSLYRRLLAMTLAELDLLESHMQQLDEELAALLRVHQDAVQRLAAVPGFGVDSAQQIIAEVGPTATTFPTAKHLASWVGACPGHDESAGINRSHRAPSGNRQMRRLLNQAAHAAVKTKGSIFELLYRRFVGRLGHAQAIGAIAHRLCRLVWKILHDGVTYEERGPVVSKARAHRRAAKMLRELRSLGYRVELIPAPSGNALMTVVIFDPVLPEGLRPSDSPTRSLARRFAGALRSRGSLAALARTPKMALAIYETGSPSGVVSGFSRTLARRSGVHAAFLSSREVCAVAKARISCSAQ